uniref:Spotted leaf protein n=1 Tax=Rhizophora mucronata TaxID=61149 RepID=A0A2P2L417_RHIMU
MAKTGVFDSDPTVMARAMELKKELQKLVKTILDDDDYRVETVDQAKEALCALKELKMKNRSLSLKTRDLMSCPEEFKCPLSKELMRDPVILCTGQVSFD